MEWLGTLTENPFFEFAVILFLAAIIGAIGQVLRQPLIVMFIALGILVGPSVLDIVKSKDNIHLLAEIGIAILLFIVGLKLDLRLIKTTGKVALLTGLGQVLFTSVVGYFIGIGLGFSALHSFYIAVALTFSSTIIIVKLLSDKKEIDSLHGQIAIGFLIVQDIVVVLVMIVLSAIRSSEGESLTDNLVQTLLVAIGMVALTAVLMKWIIPQLSHFLARSQELLTLFAIALAVSLAAFSEWIGFSAEVGAFLAGVSLASSPFKDMISSRLVSLRDFLLLFFFINLGADLDLHIMGGQLTAALVFSAFVLIGNPIIVLIIMGLMGYRKRTSFLAGLTVAQISEFSLIFAGLGLAVGHISEEIVGLITLVGLVTIGLSTYLILYSQQIYFLISKPLSLFERHTPYREMGLQATSHNHFDLIILGMGRFGGRLAEKMDEYEGVDYLGVDFDPQVVKMLKSAGKQVVYGDLEDEEILEYLPVENSKCIISTIAEVEHSVKLVKALRRRNYKGKIFLTTTREADLPILEECNPTDILRPYSMAANNFYDDYFKGIFDSKTSI